MLDVLSDCMTLPFTRLSILRPLPPGGQRVGGHDPRAEAAAAVEILAHVPLRGVALEFADRAFVAAGPAGDAGDRVLERHVLGALADDRDEFGLVVEGLRDLGTDQRLQVRHQGVEAAHEQRREFRHVVGVGAFLDVVEIVEAEADDLARPGHRQCVFQARERSPGGGRRALGDVAQRREIAVAARQHDGEIIGNGRIDRLEIDDLFALDDAEPQPRIRCEARRFSWERPRAFYALANAAPYSTIFPGWASPYWQILRNRQPASRTSRIHRPHPARI